ncbi:hypothetical protein [Streptomyces erythrochromogenes]|uniref:hypothetical protein n=1 Tax=Streptomyces erythrochromogenes TaxID=285574 RepID=UPI00224FA8FE|nr:hypothetical protein [Streptomyces erythrochromogenes]
MTRLPDLPRSAHTAAGSNPLLPHPAQAKHHWRVKETGADMGRGEPAEYGSWVGPPRTLGRTGLAQRAGSFYGAGTDDCWTGRLIAPVHVLYDDEWGAEFVYRQPRDTAQALALLGAVAQDSMAGYACDGDDHWTAEVSATGGGSGAGSGPAALDRTWSVSQRAEEREAAGGGREYVAYIDGVLAEDLRHYLLWLSEGRPADPGEPLPNLSPCGG